MKLQSFYEDHERLLPLEVEVELWPGLPEIHFLGGADQHLKESAKRIKSAIRSQGFDFRPSQQVLVNLRPSHLKKSSRGLELAIAIGYLAESGQIPIDDPILKSRIYGELSLKGDVTAPENLAQQILNQDELVVTGPHNYSLLFDTLPLKSLQDIQNKPLVQKATHPGFHWSPSQEILDLKISSSWARILGVIALGQQSLLMAGSSGSGKTTAARILHALQPDPSPEVKNKILQQLSPLPENNQVWRPLIIPHHTIPLNSLIGGGAQAHGGELARAHNGVLLLDEFFEFSPHVMEALREPMESKILRISRGSIVRTFPLQTQFIATTNLCPCGEWTPGLGAKIGCRFTLQKCRSYSTRITGPLLDRFEVLVFTQNSHHSDENLISVKELRDQLSQIRAASYKSSVSQNEQTTQKWPTWIQHDTVFQNLSQRRKAATFKLASSIAQWDQQNEGFKTHHLDEAMEFTIRNFQKVKHWDLG